MQDAYGKMLKKVAMLGNLSDMDDVIKNSSILLKKIAHIRWALVYFFTESSRISPRPGVTACRSDTSGSSRTLPFIQTNYHSLSPCS